MRCVQKNHSIHEYTIHCNKWSGKVCPKFKEYRCIEAEASRSLGREQWYTPDSLLR